MEAMEQLQIHHWKIPFELRRSNRARRLSLRIDSQNLKVILTAPPFAMPFEIERFLSRQTPWLERHWAQLAKQRKSRPKLPFSENYYRAKAERIIPRRLDFFNQHYGLQFGRVTLRNQRSRWGSCSSKKNLSFNWRLILAPEAILDYVIVHELCHLKYMNHSAAFWKLVSQTVPDYQKRKKWLKENSYLLQLN